MSVKSKPSISDLTVIDVVGLDSESHGRSCTQHLCCGHSVKVGDMLFCTWQIQLIEHSNMSEPEEVIQVYKVAPDGLAYCHVGYLPKRLFRKYGPKQFDKLFLRVLIDYRISDNSHERSRSHHFYGMALTSIIKDDIQLIGKNPLQGDRCIPTDVSNVAKLNEEESECSSIHVDLVVKKVVSNRRKPIQYLEPRIIHPVYEPRTNHNIITNNLENNNNDNNDKNKNDKAKNNNLDNDDDNVPIVNYVYYSKISELAKKIEVQQIRQRGTPDTKSPMSVRNYGKRRHTLSVDFSSESDVTITDEEEDDKIPIRSLFSSNKSKTNNRRKSSRKKSSHSY
jgi:hypothetical protein